jgi:hypothetical protein
MMLVIAFVAAWVIRHAWDEKTDEFRAHNKQVRKDINQRYPNASKDRREQMVRNAARRKAGGWNLYQLRHGWPSLWTALKDGYAEARRDHQEWVEANDKPDGEKGKKRRFRLVEAARAGWKRATAFTVAKRARRDEAEQQPTPSKTPQPAPTPAPEAASASRPKVVPINGARPASKTVTSTPNRNNGGTPMASTGETGSYAESQAFADEYLKTLATAQGPLEQYQASLMAGGLTKDPQVMGTLATAREAFDAALAAFQGHKQGLNAHEQGAEYASSKGAAAANTDWLGKQ